MSEQMPPKRRRKVNVWANDESETPNKGFNAALDLVREQQTTLPPQTAPQEKREEAPERLQHLTRGEEEEDDEKTYFEETYRRETYYIRRTNRPRLKHLLKKLKPKNKYEVMEEGLEYLFEKYGIE